MKCEYCGTDGQDGKACSKCGALLPESRNDRHEAWKSEPFFYNGYICYALSDFMNATREVQFWLGKELIERIVVPEELLRIRVPEVCDPMSFFWDLFLLAHGEEEVLRFQELNNKFPAIFEVRRIENPEKLRWQEMSLLEIARESRS